MTSPPPFVLVRFIRAHLRFFLACSLCGHGTDVNEEREGRGKEEERREKEGEKGNVGEIVPRGCVKLRRRKKRLYSNDE